jgi:hypothetical protein
VTGALTVPEYGGPVVYRWGVPLVLGTETFNTERSRK